MNRYIKPCVALFLGFTLLLSTGCSTMFRYESPEEQQQQQQQTGSGTSQKDTIDLEKLKSDDLVYSNTLRNSAGSVLATYTGRVPAFLAPSGYATAFQRINEHFQVQHNAFQEDCQAYFNRVKQFYGEDWDTVTVSAPVFNTYVSYELFKSPEHYLSLEFQYSTCLNGKETVTYRLGEVLLLDTGWVLQAGELFGSQLDEAKSRIVEGVKNWGLKKGVLTEGVATTFTAETLLKNFALTETKLVLYLDSYVMSTSDSNSYVVKLNLADYADLITDIEVPEGADDGDDDADKPLVPDQDLLPQLPGANGNNPT